MATIIIIGLAIFSMIKIMLFFYYYRKFEQKQKKKLDFQNQQRHSDETTDVSSKDFPLQSKEV